MENKAKIAFANADLQLIIVDCPKFDVCYSTSYGTERLDEVDICVDDNGKVQIQVFTSKSYTETLAIIKDRIAKIEELTADGCAFGYTL